MTTRKYSSRSQQTTLTGALTSSGTSATVVSGTALLGGVTISAGETFTVVIDPDTALEEIVDVTAVSTNTLTITRGIDGSTGQAHSAGAVVRHMAIGRDYREANTHIENTTSAHGLTLANVVKTTDTGTVTGTMIANGTIVTADMADSSITTAKIADSAVTSAKIADLTIATGDIADSAITSGKIATGAVGTAKIDDLSVTEGKLAPSAVTAGKIGTDAVTTAKIQDGAVTSAKIADGTIVNADVNSSAQIAYSKTNLTNSIVNADINVSAAIDKTKISGTAVTLGDIGTVTSTMIADGTIVNADINASAAIALSKLATDPLARANHTGTQTASTISDFDTQVRTSRLDQMAAPTASVALNSQKITGLGTPTLTTDAATKGYVDTSVSNLVASAPAALDTLNELAASLGNDANFATTVTNSLAGKLSLTGGTMSGAIAMGTNKITGLGTPTATGDAATKDYADTKLALSGGTMSGAIAMGTNKITGLGTPTANTDAATKNYVDTVTVAPSNLTGPITSVGPATAVASQTGTGSTFVMNTSPTLVTPVLGVATATSINGTSIPTSKTLVATDSTQYVVPSQTGNSGKALVTDGTTSSWSTTINGTAIPATKTLVATDSTQYVVPSQTGNSGKYLTTNGTTSSWASTVVPADYSAKGAILVGTAAGTYVAQTVGTNGQVLTANSAQADGVEWTTINALPSQTGNAGKYLTTDGTSASWATVTTDPTADIFMMMGA